MFVGNLWVFYESGIGGSKFINLKYLIVDEVIDEHVI